MRYRLTLCLVLALAGAAIAQTGSTMLDLPSGFPR
jgi:hypothetical protein